MNFDFRWILLALVPFLFVGCAPQVVYKDRPVITYVEKPVVCPTKAERERLRLQRPVPLRDQVMPATALERNAKTQAQLGRYEAEGGYADQVDAALDRCSYE